jgi:hypothetical protein
MGSVLQILNAGVIGGIDAGIEWFVNI